MLVQYTEIMKLATGFGIYFHSKCLVFCLVFPVMHDEENQRCRFYDVKCCVFKKVRATVISVYVGCN